jgi:hypothetical protein
MRHTIFVLILAFVTLDIANAETFPSRQPAQSDFYSDSSDYSFDFAHSYGVEYDIAGYDFFAVVSGQDTPNWYKFASLNLIRKTLVNAKSSLSAEEYKNVVNRLKQKLNSNENLREHLKLAQSPDSDILKIDQTKYKHTEYEMKVAFQKELAELNKLLPSDMQLPIMRFSSDRRRNALLHDARKFVSDYAKVWKTQYLPKSGLTSYADYQATLQKSTDPDVKLSVTLIQDHKIAPVILRPESARFWVPKSGFQNQYVTGSSNGLYSPETRQKTEATMYSTDVQKIQSMDLELLPKYGTLRTTPDTQIGNDSDYNWYGEDIYFIKESRIADRLTWTPGDSLNHIYEKPDDPPNFDSSPIPWGYRQLIVPFALKYLKRKYLNCYQADQYVQSNRSDYSYFELQIFGPLTLDDIEKLEFRSTPPAGLFLLELISRNIEIIDGRNASERKTWQPSKADIDEASLYRHDSY